MRIVVCEEGVWVPTGFRKKAARLLKHAVEKFPGWDKKDEEDEE